MLPRAQLARPEMEYSKNILAAVSGHGSGLVGIRSAVSAHEYAVHYSVNQGMPHSSVKKPVDIAYQIGFPRPNTAHSLGDPVPIAVCTTGKITRTRVPAPTVLSIAMVPWLRSTIALQIASPSPAPPLFRLREASAR